LATAVEEEGAPFSFNPAASVDLDGVGGASIDSIATAGPNVVTFDNADAPVGSAALATRLDHDVRVVVKVGVVAYADGVTPGDTLIVPLDELKLALGIDPLSTDDDLLLTLLESQAAAYIETQLGRRF